MKKEVKKAKSWAKKNISDPNNRRSWTLSKLKRKNYKLTKEMNHYIATTGLTEDQETRFLKLKKDVGNCSNAAIYRESLSDGHVTYIGAATCKNKLCFVCNWARQKNIRRKYMAWFKTNQTIVELHRNDNGKMLLKYTTEARYAANKYPLWQFEARLEYDLMHLTLTVPHHAKTGFNGDLYFFEKITALFNRMRKECDVWKYLVLGGEYGIETTKKENGMYPYETDVKHNGHHIHIHSLLLVRRERQSRNKLHKAILEYWNKVTIDQNSVRRELAPSVIESIIKSNRLIDLEYAKKLNPRGTTFINIQNIFTFNEAGEKERSAKWNSKEMMVAVMETISYHFDPFAFDKESQKFDLKLMAELAPVLYGKRLYDKFGCLYGEKSLNVTDDTNLAEEFDEVVSEFVDQETGEIHSAANKFWLANPLYVQHRHDNNFNIELTPETRRRAIQLEAQTTKQAVKKMADMMSEQFRKRRN